MPYPDRRMDMISLESKSGDLEQTEDSTLECQSPIDRDVHELANLGKKQVLRRHFGFMSLVGFTCITMATWETLFGVFFEGLDNGGPAGLVYGYLIVWVGVLATVACLAEMASMAPISAGQYYWVAMLAPPSCRKILSYLTGWMTVIAWQAAFASGGYLTGTFVQGLIVLNYPAYTFERWHGTLLFYAMNFFALFVNTYLSRQLPMLEGLVLVFHVLGFFAILIPLVYLASHSTASEVFGTFVNNGGWSTQGLSFFVGLNTSTYALLGADGAAHMAEEVKSASKVVPRSMVATVAINGVLGFGILIATLFSLGNVEAAINSPTGYPFIEIFAEAAGISGATTMTCIVLVLVMFANLSFLASGSRMMWAFARDNGLPGSRYLSRVEPRTSLPLYSIGLTTLISLLLALINIGSSAAFNDIISLLVSGFLGSFSIPCFLLLWRRTTGAIAPYSSKVDATTNEGVEQLYWGPWRMPPVFGIVVNIVACADMVLIIFFSFWPTSTPTTASTMNYNILVFGFAVVFSLVYYYFRGRKMYKGPLRETVPKTRKRQYFDSGPTSSQR